MIKFRLFFSKDKETEWLNRMAEQGWAMTGFFLGVYRFTRCEPGEYIYQVDILDKMFSMPESYRQFMREMGVEIVCCWGFWVMLRKKAEEGPFELYTDAESSYEHYAKIRNMFQAASMILSASLLGVVIHGEFFKGNVVSLVTALITAVFLAVFLRESMCLTGILEELKSRMEPGRGGSPSASVLRMHGGWIAVFLCCMPFLQSFLHELGHCIAVWICGGTVREFQPFGSDAHVIHEGVVGSSIAVIDVAGTVLPLMIAAAVLLFYRGSKKHSLRNILLLIMSAEFLLPVIAWIIEPLLYLLNFDDPSEDVIHFINNTGFHPAAVALCATLCFVSMAFLFARRMVGMFDEFSKSAVRKYIVMVTSVVIVMGMISFFFSTTGKTPAKGNFQYTVEGRQDSILCQEFDIDISRAGDYSFYLEWEIDREGVIAAVILKDEDGIYNGASASYLTLKSAPFYLDSGSYTLSFYFLSCEEDWLEYCRITGGDANGMEGFPWQPDGASTVTGSYRLVQVYSRN